MKPENDIRVRMFVEDVEGRLERASEIVVTNAHGYASGAVVPGDEWIDTDIQQLQTVVADEADSQGRVLSIIKLPEEVITPFRNTGVAEITSVSTFRDALRESDVVNAISKLREYVTSRYSVKGDVSEGTLGMNAPGLCTTTVDFNLGMRIGMHLDGWTDSPLRTRSTVQNRLCINLGLERRHLLFVPISIESLYASHLERGLDPEIRGTELARKSLLGNNQLSVFRMRIDPGEAYIGPTENMIHDGSTSGAKAYDFPLFLHGYFSCDR